MSIGLPIAQTPPDATVARTATTAKPCPSRRNRKASMVLLAHDAAAGARPSRAPPSPGGGRRLVARSRRALDQGRLGGLVDPRRVAQLLAHRPGENLEMQRQHAV